MSHKHCSCEDYLNVCEYLKGGDVPRVLLSIVRPE